MFFRTLSLVVALVALIHKPLYAQAIDPRAQVEQMTVLGVGTFAVDVHTDTLAAAQKLPFRAFRDGVSFAVTPTCTGTVKPFTCRVALADLKLNATYARYSLAAGEAIVTLPYLLRLGRPPCDASVPSDINPASTKARYVITMAASMKAAEKLLNELSEDGWAIAPILLPSPDASYRIVASCGGQVSAVARARASSDAPGGENVLGALRSESPARAGMVSHGH
jgi:hypothetical protein